VLYGRRADWLASIDNPNEPKVAQKMASGGMRVSTRTISWAAAAGKPSRDIFVDQA
jgi:hypothetical protein